MILTLPHRASVFQADPESALSAQGRVQGDDGRTEGSGPSAHSRYEGRTPVLSLEVQYLPGQAAPPPPPPLFVGRRDPSAGAGGGRGRVWPGGAGHEDVSGQRGGAAPGLRSSAAPAGKR